MTVDELRAFRHKVAIAKRKGAIRKSVDARSIKPTKHYLATIAKLEKLGTFEGRASFIKTNKIPAQELIKLGEVGYTEKFNKRLVVTHGPTERANVSKGHVTITRKYTGGMHIRKVVLPVKFTNLRKWLDEVSALEDYGLTGNERFAFRYWGNNSYQTFDSLDKMVDYLNHYGSINSAIDNGGVQEQHELYQHLVIYKVDQPQTWFNQPRDRSQQVKKKHYSERDRQRSKERYQSLSPRQYEARKKQMRETAKEKRAYLKATNPAAYQALLVKERNRQKQLRRKK